MLAHVARPEVDLDTIATLMLLLLRFAAGVGWFPWRHKLGTISRSSRDGSGSRRAGRGHRGRERALATKPEERWSSPSAKARGPRPLPRAGSGPARGLPADGYDGNAERGKIRRRRVPAAPGPAALGHHGPALPAALIVAAVGDHVDIGASGEVPAQVAVERAIEARDNEEISAVTGMHQTSGTRCGDGSGMESGPPCLIREAIYVPAPSS